MTLREKYPHLNDQQIRTLRNELRRKQSRDERYRVTIDMITRKPEFRVCP